MKRCTKCGVVQALEDFPRDRSRVDGRFPYCKRCHASAQDRQRRSWSEERLEAQRAKERTAYSAWRASDEASAEVIRVESQLRRYGLTPHDYEALLARQGGKCGFARCQRRPEDERHGRLHVDHCHVTGVVRGLLCFHHNAMLGHAADDPESLADGAAYLMAPPAADVFSEPRRPLERRLPRAEVRQLINRSVAPGDAIHRAARQRIDRLRPPPPLF